MALKSPSPRLKTPVPGLHRLRNNSKQPAKVSVTVAPGDELEVSDDVAAQLQAASSAIKPADGLPPFPDLSPPADDVDEAPVKVGRSAKKSAKKS